ncbi:glycosyltransferase family 2 protein [Acetobacter indonesiensis]|uniref:glycosyltransferase family 2 protein n=1 Tax=Acetobacter indonesiensis TaxID=104101 RepID=UPI0020A52B12|nr:glycosyltransferase family 2 protein [Acetobacter indonesiensis]MCP1231151.1 glycosyltransferase family 2 protein [Acetobacter indonesiensis]
MEKIAVCVVVKNEENRIKEWISYYLSMGFDTIFVYDNNSSDKTESIVKKIGNLFDVRYKKWDRNDFYYQMDAYNDCIKTQRENFRWIAFLDSDEFIVPYGEHCIKKFLSRYEEFSGVVINWAMFGSSGFISPPSGLVIENFVWRSNSQFYNAKHVKSIINPKMAEHCINAHFFKMNGKVVDVLKNEPVWEKEGIINGNPIYDICQINHYYTRSKNEWVSKIKRGYHDMDTSNFDDNKILEGFEYADRNEVFDVNIFYNIPRLKILMDYINIY